MSELKCCPFCGGEAEFVKMGIAKDIPLGFVRCTECGIRLRQENCTEDFARNEWNRRILVDNIVENIVTSLESEKTVFLGTRTEQTDTILIDDAINIVKQEINNGLE